MKVSSAVSFVALSLLFTVVQSTKTYQLAENNVIIRFDEKQAEPEARDVLAIAVEARQQLMERYQLALSAPVEIRLSETTAEFCQRTGRPWWQSSLYQNRVIYLQPLRVLRDRGILATTLRHELMHHLVNEHVKGHGPAWLNEALAIYNSGEVAFLKPQSSWKNQDDLTWGGLERRLQTARNKDEFDRLYFQFYYLGQFLETNFQLRQITALLLLLGEEKPLEQACTEACGLGAQEIEQGWLRYWVKTVK